MVFLDKQQRHKAQNKQPINTLKYFDSALEDFFRKKAEALDKPIYQKPLLKRKLKGRSTRDDDLTEERGQA